MATTAPTVQTLNQIMASLQPGYSAQNKIINQQIANTDATYKANQLSLDAAKAEGFDQINAQATGRGTAFSGIPLDEQATYLSNVYLPGVQKAQAQQQSDKLTLAGQAASMQTDQRNQALNLRSKQQSDLNSWNMTLMQQKFQAEQAEKDRQARAAEAAKERQFTASQNAAANRTTAAAAQTPSLVANIRAYLENYVDPATGYVPKNVWRNAVQLAHESDMMFGGKDGFANTFWGYADNNKWQDYKIGYDQFLQ